MSGCPNCGHPGVSVNSFAKRTARRDAAGLCVICGKNPQPRGNVKCADCMTAERLRARARAGYRGDKRCSICRQTGHDKRACPRAEAA